jgi:hypothetical protein
MYTQHLNLLNQFYIEYVDTVIYVFFLIITNLSLNLSFHLYVYINLLMLYYNFSLQNMASFVIISLLYYLHILLPLAHHAHRTHLLILFHFLTMLRYENLTYIISNLYTFYI